MQQRLDRLELRVLERDAQVEDLQARLDTARQEVVAAMAKVQTLATRAEAASGMAEAEVALQSLRTAAGDQTVAEIDQVARLVRMGSAEFDKGNYGGALYLSNQAKSAAATGRGRLAASSDRAPLKPGEVSFALPIPLQAAARGNVRAGPGTNYDVIFTLDPGAALTGYSYVEDWVRVADDAGRSGWVFRNLLSRRSGR